MVIWYTLIEIVGAAHNYVQQTIGETKQVGLYFFLFIIFYLCRLSFEFQLFVCRSLLQHDVSFLTVFSFYYKVFSCGLRTIQMFFTAIKMAKETIIFAHHTARILSMFTRALDTLYSPTVTVLIKLKPVCTRLSINNYIFYVPGEYWFPVLAAYYPVCPGVSHFSRTCKTYSFAPQKQTTTAFIKNHPRTALPTVWPRKESKNKQSRIAETKQNRSGVRGHLLCRRSATVLGVSR